MESMRKAGQTLRRNSRKNKDNHNNVAPQDKGLSAVQPPPPPPRTPSPDEAALTAKNYRMAKELSELRVRHREECKTVTRLTMDNMNLASRCREAISQVARLKKELAKQQAQLKAASSVAPLKLDVSASPTSSTVAPTTASTTLSNADERDDDNTGMMLRVPSHSTSVSSNEDPTTPEKADGPLVTTTPASPPREQSVQRQTRPESASPGQELPSDPVDSDDFVEEMNTTLDRSLKFTPTKEAGDDESESSKEPTSPDVDASSLQNRKAGPFPATASPKPNVNRFNDDIYPGDITSHAVRKPAALQRMDLMMVHGEQAANGEQDNNTNAKVAAEIPAANVPPPAPGRTSDLLHAKKDWSTISSIDAFEASFSTDFPDSFSPREEVATVSPMSKDSIKSDNYNPFFPSPPKAEPNPLDIPSTAAVIPTAQSSISETTTSIASSSSRLAKKLSASSADAINNISVSRSVQSDSASIASNSSSHSRRASSDPPGKDRTSVRLSKLVVSESGASVSAPRKGPTSSKPVIGSASPSPRQAVKATMGNKSNGNGPRRSPTTTKKRFAKFANDVLSPQTPAKQAAAVPPGNVKTPSPVQSLSSLGSPETVSSNGSASPTADPGRPKKKGGYDTARAKYQKALAITKSRKANAVGSSGPPSPSQEGARESLATSNQATISPSQTRRTVAHHDTISPSQPRATCTVTNPGALSPTQAITSNGPMIGTGGVVSPIESRMPVLLKATKTTGSDTFENSKEDDFDEPPRMSIRKSVRDRAASLEMSPTNSHNMAPSPKSRLQELRQNQLFGLPTPTLASPRNEMDDGDIPMYTKASSLSP